MARRATTLTKTPSGIRGFDEVTLGGLPKGRATLLCGSAGSGKTMMAMEFLVHGVTDYGEPGVYFAFEETADELVANIKSLGLDLDKLQADGKLVIDHVHVERRHIEETGEYDLDGLFIRLEQAIKVVKAKRVVLDTIEALFAGLRNQAILRAEFRRLFRWLKDVGVTYIVTAERGIDTLTRHGLEEYVADCVILLDHRVTEQVSTRRLRVVKYRGSSHGTNEYPFLITSHGVSVLPITSLGLQHTASTERISSGVSELDSMLDGNGYYRGSSVLVSGTAGTGKSSLAAHFVAAACERGERALYFAFEESPSQIERNMRSIGLDLEPYVKKGQLRIDASRPTRAGLETHLSHMQLAVSEFKPSVVVVDPITNLISVSDLVGVKAMLTRLIDFLKGENVTGLYTNLIVAGQDEQTGMGISSLMDAWIVLRDTEASDRRRRNIVILKARGMNHSNQVREFYLTNNGFNIAGANGYEHLHRDAMAAGFDGDRGTRRQNTSKKK